MVVRAKEQHRRRHELEFLPAALEVLETPPHPAARLTAAAIMAFFVATLVWSIVGQIDTVAVAQAQIVPSARVQLIQPLENGIVRAIRVRDGQRVTTGDVLIELDPTESAANIDALRYDLMKARLDAATATALLTEDPDANFRAPDNAPPLLLEASLSQMKAEAGKLHAALLSLDAEIAEQQATVSTFRTQHQKAEELLPLLEDRLAGLAQLEEQGLARKPDIIAARQQHVEARAEKANAVSGVAQAEARISARLNRKDELQTTARAEAHDKRSEALRRVASLEQQLRKEERRQEDRHLRAPVAGTIVGLSVYTVGGVVTTKDVLMRIVPEDSALELEATVLNRDIGFVAVGQSAEIKLETFPFTRYGLVHGTVTQVWRDAIPDDKQGLVYKAEISLVEDKIQVGDQWVPLSPGMAAQAEIATGRRRAIEYFLSPFLRYYAEALRER